MNKRIVVGFVASVMTAAGGTLWPRPWGLVLVALGVITNGVLISAMSAAFGQWERMLMNVMRVAQEFEDMSHEAKGFGAAAQRLRAVLRGENV